MRQKHFDPFNVHLLDFHSGNAEFLVASFCFLSKVTWSNKDTLLSAPQIIGTLTKEMLTFDIGMRCDQLKPPGSSNK